MKFLKFMLLLLGAFGFLLILTSTWMLFVNQSPETITNVIAYLSISIGILYLLFIGLIFIILKKFV
ncbi:MAG: hypothetical protein N3D75_01650 [Candidatus Aenigmarchaeota archaeon]|nr:hypothetical protein [Candidatus Aenigmarchaeota archaeon]